MFKTKQTWVAVAFFSAVQRISHIPVSKSFQCQASSLGWCFCTVWVWRRKIWIRFDFAVRPQRECYCFLLLSSDQM